MKQSLRVLDDQMSMDNFKKPNQLMNRLTIFGNTQICEMHLTYNISPPHNM